MTSDGDDRDELRAELEALRTAADTTVSRHALKWAIRWTIGSLILTGLVVWDARAWTCVWISIPIALLSLMAPMVMKRRLLERVEALEGLLSESEELEGGPGQL